MQQLDMDLDDLYQRYVGKNILNIFRQDNGYKTDEYVKLWDDREDNEWLEDILGGLDVNSGLIWMMFMPLCRIGIRLYSEQV